MPPLIPDPSTPVGTHPLRAVAVFCGSLPGTDGRYREAAADLGRRLAARDIALVYGGGRVGLMGAVADGAIDAGGRVIGVIPQALVDRELAHQGCTELLVTHSMHERKARMADLADAFVALPGGAGTLDELFEAWTWTMLGVHAKPCAILDIAGYHTGLLAHIRHMRDTGFVDTRYVDGLVVDTDPDGLLDRLVGWRPPTAKWVDAPPPP
ncbi:MAG: TIGR00730 family Rossman fold protein [Chloroflexi bacterium]|nr:TIGR00730 family Rossman fold protein [Chloroflexota bacterium]